MAGLLENIDMRTRLAGHNRLELLLFRIAGRQRYGINVFKVREVIECPPLRRVPTAHPAVRGVAHIRGRTLPIVDLGLILGRRLPEDVRGLYVVIAEFNRSVQGFLVSSVDRIINLRWEEVLPPPSVNGANNYLTAVTQADNELIEIIDVEKVLAEVSPAAYESATETAADPDHAGNYLPVLVVDDSSTARKMIARTLEQAGLKYFMAVNGREALDMLHGWVREGQPIGERIGMVVSDIEMPELDGYTLTAEIRKDPQLKDLYVLLHSSLSGVFNDAMVERVGADRFLPKFNAGDLTQLVQAVLRDGQRNHAQP